uniref:Sulfotransferase domain-containing protein n=1 Tax=Strigamia maritima TaxID=126957 RepID=T1J648_STRMM
MKKPVPSLPPSRIYRKNSKLRSLFHLWPSKHCKQTPKSCCLSGSIKWSGNAREKMIRMRKLFFAFSFLIILCLVIYASKNFTRTSSVDAYDTQVIIHLVENKTAKPAKKAIVSSIPIAAPIVDISRIQKTSIIRGQSKVRNYSALKSPIRNTISAVLPRNTDVRPLIANPEKYALSTARLRVRIELFGVNSLTGFISKSSGLNSLPPLNIKKKQILLLTYWRSGSTFVGDILNHYPGTFYHFEPLHSVSGSDVINKTMEDKAVKFMSDLFSCSYTPENDYYLKWVKQEDNQFLFQHNTRLWTSCRIKPKLCFDAKFVSAMCSEFPFQVMKVTRISLKPIMQLLDQYPELKIIYLVRDPRGILSSRLKLDWCRDTRSCIDPEIVCSAMREDIATMKLINEKYPNRILLLRYEDVSLFPEEKRNEAVGGPYSTKRNSKVAAFAWRSKVNFSDVVTIQSTCSDIITGLGYDDLTGYVSKSSGLDFLPPLNKKKKQIMILAYWRSGSTFFGEILNHHPRTFYHYKPLHPVVGHSLVNKTMEDIAVKLLSDLLNCSYPLIKVTRLTLESTMQLLDQYPELKIIFLIRDPRGIMSSRMKLDWCRASRSCIDPEILCSSMRQSIASMKVMNIRYPNRILLVRYEDVALYPEEK